MYHNVMGRQEIINTIIKTLKSRNAVSVSLFGSFARAEEHSGSDIDLLVKFSPNKSIFEMLAIEQELEELTGRKVDLLTEHSLSPYIIDQIRREMRVLYQ